MRYWIVSLPRQDMENCIRIGTFGLGRKHTISRVQNGDKVVCCCTKEWAILALGDVTSDYYLDDKAVFLKKGVFPDRFDFQAEILPSPQQACLKEIIGDISCVKRPEHWPVYFKNSITEINEEDWSLIGRFANVSTSAQNQ